MTDVVDISNMSRNGRVCRDWENMVCNRGDKCSYDHPPEIEQPKERLNVCRDFQNRDECSRKGRCRALHLNRIEESHFYKTGEMPDHGGDAKKVGSIDHSNIETKRSAPICNDDLQGRCNRGFRCQFRHASDDKHYRQDQNHRNDMNDRNGPLQGHREGAPSSPMGMSTPFIGSGASEFLMNMQRGMMMNATQLQQQQPLGSLLPIPPHGSFEEQRFAPSEVKREPSSLVDHDEVEKMRKRIDDLQNQVIDLRATNSKLYDQNTAQHLDIEEKQRTIEKLLNASTSSTPQYSSATATIAAGGYMQPATAVTNYALPPPQTNYSASYS